jgi:hypothetical protein
MALKYDKDHHVKLVKDEKIVNHPEGQGLVKRSGKVDTTLSTRKGLINGPPASKQEEEIAPKNATKASMKKKFGGFLK